MRLPCLSAFGMVLLLSVLLSGCGSGTNASQVPASGQGEQAAARAPAVLSATPSPTARPTDTPTTTLTPTASATPTASPSPTLTPTATATPGPTPDGEVRSARVPILMYHYVSVPPPDADIYRRDLSVTPVQLEAQLKAMQAAGYTSVALAEVISHLAQGRPLLPDKTVVLTFDDGYEDNYTNAFPLLKKYGFTATFFVITDFVDNGRAGYMTWEQLREMHAAGMDIGSHSRDHPDMAHRDVDYLVWEVLGSREMIESRLGFTPRLFCYPSGQYDDLAIRVVQSANFWGAVTTQQGATHTSDHLYELSRVRVRGDYTVDTLLRLLTVDW